MRVYLDNCVFNRPFDDQSQLLISLQTQAKLAIQELIRARSLELTWSYMLDYENAANPFDTRRRFVDAWKAMASGDIDGSVEIIVMAEELARKGIAVKDALHLACAREGKCDLFITTDSRILKLGRVESLRILDPVAFFSYLEEVKHGD